MSRDWSVLRNLAEKATQGEWQTFRSGGPVGASVKSSNGALIARGHWTRDDGYQHACSEDDAEFISAASPGAVKELIEENEKLRGEKPKCSCTPMPSGDGPEEDCEQHGRSYDWWVGLANKACEDRAEATAQALRWEERADKLDRSLTAAIAVLEKVRTALAALGEPHEWLWIERHDFENTLRTLAAAVVPSPEPEAIRWLTDEFQRAQKRATEIAEASGSVVSKETSDE